MQYKAIYLHLNFISFFSQIAHSYELKHFKTILIDTCFFTSGYTTCLNVNGITRE